MTEIPAVMVERVARAISAAFREEGSFWDGAWESAGEQAAFHESARAAIAAMREPTEAMLRAGDETDDGAQGDNTMTSQACWAAMIAAALEEGR